MEPITDLLMPLFSLTGIVIGIVLSYIAPEELVAGKRYLILFRQSLFAIISGIIIFYFWQSRQIIFLILFILFAAVLFFVELKLKSKQPNKYYGAHYLIFILPYFLNQNLSFRLILLSLIFLYGFPLGTLLRAGSSK